MIDASKVRAAIHPIERGHWVWYGPGIARVRAVSGDRITLDRLTPFPRAYADDEIDEIVRRIAAPFLETP